MITFKHKLRPSQLQNKDRFQPEPVALLKADLAFDEIYNIHTNKYAYVGYVKFDSQGNPLSYYMVEEQVGCESQWNKISDILLKDEPTFEVTALGTYIGEYLSYCNELFMED